MAVDTVLAMFVFIGAIISTLLYFKTKNIGWNILAIAYMFALGAVLLGDIAITQTVTILNQTGSVTNQTEVSTTIETTGYAILPMAFGLYLVVLFIKNAFIPVFERL